MNIFSYSNGKIELNLPEVLLVKEFTALMNADTTKDKRFAYEVLKYAYLMYDWKSIYNVSNYDEEERKRYAREDCVLLKEKNFDNDVVKNAVAKYKEIVDRDLTMSLIIDMKTSISKFRRYFEELDFTKKVGSGARKGTLLYSPKEYLDVMKRSQEIFSTIEILEQKLRESQTMEKIETRGNKEVGVFNE